MHRLEKDPQAKWLDWPHRKMAIRRKPRRVARWERQHVKHPEPLRTDVLRCGTDPRKPHPGLEVAERWIGKERIAEMQLGPVN